MCSCDRRNKSTFQIAETRRVSATGGSDSLSDDRKGRRRLSVGRRRTVDRRPEVGMEEIGKARSVVHRRGRNLGGRLDDLHAELDLHRHQRN